MSGRVFSELASLLKVLQRPGSLVPGNMSGRSTGFACGAQGRQVVIRHFIVDWTGYFAGPGVHIIDAQALSDLLLARIPGDRLPRSWVTSSVDSRRLHREHRDGHQPPDGFKPGCALRASSCDRRGPLWNRARTDHLSRGFWWDSMTIT